MTKTKSEVWQAKLGVSLAGVDGVRLGWCWHEGLYYKPVEVPPYVAKFLGLRIVPADYMWPFYVDEAHVSLEQVMRGAGVTYTIFDAAEGIIEFVIDTGEDEDE